MIKRISKILIFCVFVIALLSSCQAKKEEKAKAQKDSTKTQKIVPEAQDNIEVSDAEVKQFIVVANKLRSSQGKIRMEFTNTIKNSDLGMQKYQAIAQSERKPKDSTQQQKFTQQELQDYENLTQELSKIQQKAQKDAERLIEKEGMKIERYKAISRTAQQDTTLQKRLQAETIKQRKSTQKSQAVPNQ